MEEQVRERYELSMERIARIQTEETVDSRYRGFFAKTAGFITGIDRVKRMLETGEWDNLSQEELARENQDLYSDILPEAYGQSYADPAYAVSLFGEEYGRLLSFLYTEVRGEIAYAFDGKERNMTICNELFIEIYNCFEEQENPDYEELRRIIYWYASDYADVFAAENIVEHIDPDCGLASGIVMDSDLNDLRYLYRYGEYISENEIRTAEHLNALPEEVICKMADTYTEGYRIGFVVGRKDLSKKKTVSVIYPIGFERVIRKLLKILPQWGFVR